MPNDHFVPRHYLRRFAVGGTELIVRATVSPYKLLGANGIGGECCEDDFYENDAGLNKLLWATENGLAPLLVRVTENEAFDGKELSALQGLAVILHLRTRKESEIAKEFPRKMVHEVIGGAIERGELPPPPGGKLTDEMFDITGMSGLLIEQALPCWMEMLSLDCKLLRAADQVYFITSDNPVVITNQFCAGHDTIRSYAGFSQTGFQLLLPISPKLCLFFYDPKVYKVGNRKDQLVRIAKEDVEIVNALQIQSAAERLYFHDVKLGQDVQRLVALNSHLRVPISDSLRVMPGPAPNQEILHVRTPTAKLPAVWRFCRYRRHIKLKPGDRRNPALTELADRLIQDLKNNPHGGDFPTRLERLI